MAGLHRTHGGKAKYLVLRRDGTRPEWEWFVMGERDPWAPAGLRAYAAAALEGGCDPQYHADLMDMADKWDKGRRVLGVGDPDAPLHRKDDPVVCAVIDGTVDPGNLSLAIPVVTVDMQPYVDFARNTLCMDTRAATSWAQSKFDEVVKALSEIKADDIIVSARETGSVRLGDKAWPVTLVAGAAVACPRCGAALSPQKEAGDVG